MRYRLKQKAAIRVSGSLATALLFCTILIAWLAMSGLAASDIARQSTATDGTQGNGDSQAACISVDGHFVAFESAATNLVANDAYPYKQIFLKNTQTGTISLISSNSTGVAADAASSHCDISADGKLVAFESNATNLVADDTNGFADIFLKNTETGVTTRLSTDSAGTQATNDSMFPSMSSDGRYVAFQSWASDLVAGDTNSVADVFVKDTTTGATTRISTTSSGGQATLGESYEPSISSDGSLVAFSSNAADLVTGDTNSATDVFVKNRDTGATTRVSVSQAGAEGNSGSYSPSMSDVRYVAFVTEASNLFAGDANLAIADVVVKNLQTAVVTLASAGNGGVQSGSTSRLPSISDDGRRVAFEAIGGDLYSGHTATGTWDIFVKDTLTGTLYFLPVNNSGVEGNGDSTGAALSGDGSKTAFTSKASNLVSGDTNNALDVFSASPLVTDVAAAQTTTVTNTVTQLATQTTTQANAQTSTTGTGSGTGTTTTAAAAKPTSLPKTGGGMLTVAWMASVFLLIGGGALYAADRGAKKS